MREGGKFTPGKGAEDIQGGRGGCNYLIQGHPSEEKKRNWNPRERRKGKRPLMQAGSRGSKIDRGERQILLRVWKSSRVNYRGGALPLGKTVIGKL